MGVEYHAVFKDGEFMRRDSLEQLSHVEDYVFLVKKVELEPRQANTYGYYDFIFVDSTGRECTSDYRGYELFKLYVRGQAADYQLILEYRNPDGVFRKREFRSDISFNKPRDGYSIIDDEWKSGEEYKAVFSFIDDLIKLGDEAYFTILDLKRKLFAEDANRRWDKHEFEKKIADYELFMECVEEIIIPDTWTSVDICYKKNLKRVFLPETVQFINQCPFFGCDSIKMIVCLAKVPPRVIKAYREYGPDTTLYVPKRSQSLYEGDEMWRKIFPVIKGI